MHVVNKQVVSYVMPLENALRVLSKYSRTTGRSELQHDVIRLSLASVYHLLLRNSATQVTSLPSTRIEWSTVSKAAVRLNRTRAPM